jgi:hypothetical protein
MLLPQFSLRWILAATAGFALVFLVISYAFRESAWAVGVTMAFVALSIVVCVHAVAFGVVWILSQITRRRRAASPFTPTRIQPGSPFQPPAGEAKP